MATIAENLNKLLNIKAAIKEALFFVGQEVADKMEDWAMAIRNICNVPFENLGYTEEQAKHCRQIITQSYKKGLLLKSYNETGIADDYNNYRYSTIIVPSVEFAIQGGITPSSQYVFAFNVGTYPNITAITASQGMYCNYFYIDLNLPNCTEINGFQNNPGLIYIKLDVSNVKNMATLIRTNNIGNANLLRVVRITGLGTQEESDSWEGLRYKPLLGIPLEIENDTITINARQDLIDTLLTNSFDRASAGYSVFTITLSQETFNLLTQEEITAITNKGYTIIV